MAVIITLLAIAAICIPAAIIIPCRKITGTCHIRRFTQDRLYWALAVLNYRYRLATAERKSTEEFILDLSELIDKPTRKGRRSRWQELNAEQSKTFAKILHDEKFIRMNFGSKTYDPERHEQILARL